MEEFSPITNHHRLRDQRQLVKLTRCSQSNVLATSGDDDVFLAPNDLWILHHQHQGHWSAASFLIGGGGRVRSCSSQGRCSGLDGIPRFSNDNLNAINQASNGAEPGVTGQVEVVGPEPSDCPNPCITNRDWPEFAEPRRQLAPHQTQMRAWSRPIRLAWRTQACLPSWI